MRTIGDLSSNIEQLDLVYNKASKVTGLHPSAGGEKLVKVSFHSMGGPIVIWLDPELVRSVAYTQRLADVAQLREVVAGLR